MKKLTLLAVATTMMLSSCMDKAEIQRLERKRFVQDSVQHRIDSLKTTDMHLSFMGIVIGESADSVTKAIEDGTLNVQEQDAEAYVGTVRIPYTYGYHNESSSIVEAFFRIYTANSLVASIELKFSNRNAYYFFQDTYRERYYDRRLVDEFYDFWRFKGKHIDLSEHRNEDNTRYYTVEYVDSTLHKIVMDRELEYEVEREYQESLKEDSAKKVMEEKHNRLKSNIWKEKSNSQKWLLGAHNFVEI